MPDVIPTDREQTDLIFPIGQEVGRYRIEALIGVGGMGQVYRAFHLDLEKDFALKVIRKDFIGSAGEVDRFRQEAKIAHRLKHPNIVPIDDFNLHEGVCYLRMPYFEGIEVNGKWAVSLHEYLKFNGKALEVEQARKWLIHIFCGIAYAHESSIIHRDLKPSNILLHDERAMVADFGLVRIVGEDFLQSRVRLSVYNSRVIVRDSSSRREKKGSTSDSALVGTYEFMAPEIKDGMEASELSDIYAVGLIGLFMLTGRSTLGIGMPSANFNWIPPEWDEFFKLTLNTDPDGRFQSAREAINWLEDVSAGNRRRKGRKKPTRKRSSGLRTITRLLQGTTVLAIALGGLMFFNRYFAGNHFEQLWNSLTEQVESGVEAAGEIPAVTAPDEGQNPGNPQQTTPDRPTEPVPVVDVGDGTEPLVERGAEPAPALPPVPSDPPKPGRFIPEKALPPEPPPQEGRFSVPELPTPSTGVTRSGPGPPPGGGEEQGRLTEIPEEVSTPSTIAPIPDPVQPVKPVEGDSSDGLSIRLCAGGLMEFIRVQKGPTPYGSAFDENGRTPSEAELTQISIDREFYMGKFEVTCDEYKALMGRNPGRFPGPDMPVNNIGYSDVQDFLKKLNAHLQETGKGYLQARLPTQEEWEYAARAGEGGPFAGLPDVDSTGRDLERYANFSGRQPVGVGENEPNKWGFFNIYGNIEEVTEGGYIRGGSFQSEKHNLRSAAVRPLGKSFSRDETIGFRVVIEERR